MGVQRYLLEQGIETPVVNIPCCPSYPEWLDRSLFVEYALTGRLPRLDTKSRPAALFGRPMTSPPLGAGIFENGEFVYRFGQRGGRKGILP